MDFWSRLVRGSTPQKKRAVNATGPQIRLAQLKRAYNGLLQIWHNGDGVSDDAFVVENVRICLNRLVELLNDDQRGPTPHLCVSFAATSRILVLVARISAAFQNDAITQEALSICSLLIDSEEEAFLEDKGFADALPEFIESIQKSARRVNDHDIESSMVELLFGIAAKLRVEPHVLRVWFRPEKPEEDDEDLSDDERRTRWEEFPLFYVLLSYVPSEGRTGEFGRMGLLYIIEMASSSSDLEKWLVGGDMAALMASSLGALYSQLGRKLALEYPSGDVPSILLFSERLGSDVPADAVSTISAEYQAHLGTFLASLVFWQDLLEHCTSNEVKQTLLDHFQYLFLQQLLYPSLLESSDIDGGSSVAVLTYLRHILESIDHPDLVRLTLQYLFGLQQQQNEETNKSRPSGLKARRRKSQTLIAKLAEEDQPTPELFNLADLIMSSLRSQSQQTVTATLHILSAMLRRPHHQSLTTLLRTRPVPGNDTKRTVGGHEKEIEKILSLAEDLTAFQDLESSYERHVFDNRNTLELHPCTVQLLSLPVSNKTSLTLGNEKKTLSHKTLVPEDPTFKSLVGLLDSFFQNDIETNLGVTQVLIDLASCGYMRLEGWLLSSTSSYEYPNMPPPSQSEEAPAPQDQYGLSPEKLYQIKHARIPPRTRPDSISPIIQSLNSLTKVVDIFRRTIPQFDAHLLTCRSIIETPASRAPSPNPPPPSTSRSPARAIDPNWKPQLPPRSGAASPTPNLTPTPATSGPFSRLIPSSNNPSRAYSPRGRLPEPPAQDLGTPPSLIARFGRLQTSPSRSPPAANTPTKNQSRSPLRREALVAPLPSDTPTPVLRVPDVLRRRVRLTSATTVRGAHGAYSKPRRDVLDSSEDDDAESETEKALEANEMGAMEDTPSKVVRKSRQFLGVQGKRQGHKKSASMASATSMMRGRNEGTESASEEENDGTETGGGGLKKEGIGVTSPTGVREDDDSAENGEGEDGGRREKLGRVGEDKEGKVSTVSLGHLCTNVIILQEFALEVAAIVEVRGALFEEVRYL